MDQGKLGLRHLRALGAFKEKPILYFHDLPVYVGHKTMAELIQMSLVEKADQNVGPYSKSMAWRRAPIAFRALSRGDFPLVEKWLSEPHVDAWWHKALNIAALERLYGPRIDGIEPTHVFIIIQSEKPIGMIQWYRWSDYPDYALPVGAGPGKLGWTY